MRETIRDAHNKIIGYLVHQPDGTIRVIDEHQNLLGRVKPGHGTYNEHNRLVSHQEEPGLLLRNN